MPTTNIVSGTKLRALLARFNLAGNEGSKIAGELLGYKWRTISHWLSRGISRNHLDLLEHKLKEKYNK
jgi:hypothetical protein